MSWNNWLYADRLGEKETIQKPKTNADRIRAMSDEELARYMAEIIENIDSQTCCYSHIPDEWLSWLQQPADKGE